MEHPHEIHLSVRALAEFLLRSGSLDSRFTGLDRAALGGRIHRRLQKQGGDGYSPEVPLSLVYRKGDFCYHLAGRADGVLREDGKFTVDEIKTTALPLEALSGESIPAHLAQGRVYAHMLCEARGLPACAVRLTYCNIDTGEVKRIAFDYTAGELRNYFEGLIAMYERWARHEAEWKEKRGASLQALAFPFETYRAGQRELAVVGYRTFEAGGRLLASAPTGIGKTASTLFPAMKALGEGHGARIFYLTSKTITRKAAEDAIALMRARQPGLQFLSLTLTAKDKVCFLPERNCTPAACPFADGYFDRVNDAVYDILQTGGALGRPEIEQYARQYRLCPYELSLDLALWCDCVVCDYNYLFDPVVHLQRFFEGGGDYLFLIDEAHNLVDRSRDMYSASLSKKDFAALRKLVPKQYKKLRSALSAINSAFLDIWRGTGVAGEDEEDVTPLEAASARGARRDAPGAKDGVLWQAEPFTQLDEPLWAFLEAARRFLEDHRGAEWEPALLDIYFAATFYQRIMEQYGDNYLSLAYKSPGDTTVKLFCLDASEYIDESLSTGRAAVFFSATLLPMPYYRETFGSPDAKLLALESPFAHENLGLFVASGISTKYADRQRSLPDVAALLAEMVAAKAGNYIAYFPSYKYMNDVLDAFTAAHPHVKTHVQTGGMSEAAREAYLAAFEETDGGADGQGCYGETMLGFCVLGGIFSEGVDLPGDRLIGCAVVGVGLPQIGPEPDGIKNYYDEKNGAGFAFAYTYPGMNKVLQAAGRVIRTATDRGVVLLIDSRFATARYQALFPPHWAHWRDVSRATLPGELAAFWGAPNAQADENT